MNGRDVADRTSDKAREALRAARRGLRHLETRIASKVGVFAFHSVTERHLDPWDLCLPPSSFAAQLSVLKESGRIERLDVALQPQPTKRLPNNNAVYALTFDDGYVDNLHNAVAILERYDAPATIFIATGLLDQRDFWWDRLADLALGSGATPGDLAMAASAVGLVPSEDVDALVTAALVTIHDQIHGALILLPLPDITAKLVELADRLGRSPADPSTRPMTTDEMLEIARHPLITIGVHTVTHPRLTSLEPKAVEAEITESARRLDVLLGPGERILAYPYGAATKGTAKIAKSCGFARAVTTDSRWVGLHENPLRIPRLNPRDMSGEQFREWIQPGR